MRVLIMPDSFKGSLDAAAAARAIATGVVAGNDTAQIKQLPIGDGGENTVACLQEPLNLVARTARVHGADGRMRTADYMLSPDGRTVYLQASAVVGYADYVRSGQSSLSLSTYGIGELLQQARRKGAQSAVLALGGTATTDGGVGMLQALGWQLPGLRDEFAGGMSLTDITELGAPDNWDMQVVALVDVDNPLLGRRGAAAVFGPQKGLNRAEMAATDDALARLYPQNIAKTAGSGAAGGLGAAVVGPLGGQLTSGIEYVLDAMNADDELARADLLITGEGHLDDQSTHGKALDGLMRRLRRVQGHAKTVALCGAVSHAGARQLGLDLALAISPGNQTLEQQLATTAANLAAVAAGITRICTR